MGFSKPRPRPKPKPAAISRKGAIRSGTYKKCPGCTGGKINGMRHGRCGGSGLIPA